MAKPKHSTALFEVVSRSKHPGSGNRGGFLSSLSRWLGPRGGAVGLNTSANPAISACQPVSTAVPEQSAQLTSSESPAIADDPTGQEIHLRLSYTSLIILAVALCTVVAGAYVAGRKSLTPRMAVASESTDARHQDPTPNILDLDKSVQDVPSKEAMGIPPQDTMQAKANPAAPRTRIINLNYVVMQTYPAGREQKANEAAEFLRQNGIDCSVVKGLPRWTSKDSFSVVGYEGFARISNNPQLEAYKKKIKEISDLFAKKGSFDAFEPKEYKWQ